MSASLTSRISLRFARFTQFAFVALTIAALSISAGCSKDEKEQEPVVSVQVVPAAKSSISQIVSSEAVVFPLQQAVIAPKITSTITDFKVQRGSHVKKGQLLAVLENRDLAASERSAEGDLKQAEATYATTVNAGLPQQVQKAEGDAAAAKASLDAQQKVYESRKQLFQQGAIPRRDLDSAEVAFVQARAQNEQAQKLLADLQRLGKQELLKSAEGSKESAEGKHGAAAAQLSYSRITSPIDGVVTDRPLYVGDLATANQPILTVMNTSRLIAKSHIPQPEAVTLKVGDSAELKIAGLDAPVNGRVTLVSPALDPGSTTIEVWVEARKPDPALRPGMTVQLSMIARTVNNTIVIPADAVFKNSDGASYVLLAGSDNKAHQKIVQTGVRNGNSIQITGGISARDPVIASGGYAVPDGTKIKIEQPAAPETPAKGESAPADKDKE